MRFIFIWFDETVIAWRCLPDTRVSKNHFVIKIDIIQRDDSIDYKEVTQAGFIAAWGKFVFDQSRKLNNFSKYIALDDTISHL